MKIEIKEQIFKAFDEGKNVGQVADQFKIDAFEANALLNELLKSENINSTNTNSP